MRQLLLGLILLLLGANLSAQAPDTLWSRLYGDKPGWDGYDQLYGATPTYDGGFAMNGYSTSWGDTIKGDQWVVKINSSGDTLWTATFGDFDRRDYGRDIIESYDNCLVILGHGRVASQVEDYRIRLFKADSLGNELWDKNYVNAAGFNTESIIETADSGFAITGWTDTRDVFLFRADSLGDSVWAQLYGGGSNDMGYDLCQTADGGFIIAGATESYGEGSSDVYIIKTDANGDTLWTRTVGGINYEEALGIAPTHDGHYMVAGWGVNVNNDGYLVKIQDNGDTLWAKFMGKDDASDIIYGITPTADNGFLLAGKYYNSIDYHNDMYMMKIDANGDSLWSYSYVHNIHDEARVALQAANGNIYLFGTRAASSSGSWRDYWVFAFNNPVSVTDDDGGQQPGTFTLSPNYPNPFNPATTIEYYIPSRSQVTIEVFNLLGQRIRTLVKEAKPAGEYSTTWDGAYDDGTPAATGIYFYRLKTGDNIKTRKMLLLK